MDKDPLLVDLLLVMVAPVVMAADSLTNRPQAPLPVPILSTFHPYPNPQGLWVSSHNSLTNDWIFNRRLWQWFNTVDTDRSGHISVVELR